MARTGIKPVSDTALDAAVARAEARFARAARRIFTEVIDRMIANATAEPALAAAAVDPDDLIVVTQMWRAEIPGLMAEIEGAYGTSIEGVVAAVTPAGLTPVSVPAILDQYGADHLAVVANRLVGFADPWWTAARKQLTVGFEAGEAIPQLAARVRNTIGVGVSRARTIARTEVIAASNAGSLTGALALPPEFQPTTKTWLATSDARTRPTHQAANGQTVRLNDYFNVGGASMPRPGDGPAAEVISCRCTLTFGDEPG